MDSNKPLVSLGLPTYNRAFCIKRALDSLLAQTHKNFELIIADNASTDDTQKICEEYARKDKRVRYLRQTENLGYAKNFYSVVAAAKGDYFMRVSDDDWWAPECVEKLVNVLENNKKYGAALSSFHFMNHDGSFARAVMLTGPANVIADNHYDVYKKTVMRVSGLDHFTFGLIRKEFLSPWLTRQLPACKAWDAILVSELALLTRFYTIPDVLVYYANKNRAGGGSHTVRFHNKKKLYLISTSYAGPLFASLWHILTSRVVPLRRKLFIFIPWLGAVWEKRRKFFGFFYGDYGRFFKMDYWKQKRAKFYNHA